MGVDVSIGEAVTMRTGSECSLGRIDQYELIRELGGGGFGTVFLARDTVADIDVAVKGLPPLVRNNGEELDNICKNFKLVSRLHHPHIAAALVLHPAKSVTYADRSVAEKLRVFEGDFLVVMAFATGVTLSQWRRQFPGGKVPREKAIEIVRQIADALDYAHGERIIHRDIKPANVMIETKQDDTSVARVLDFGLAAEVRSSMGRVSRQVTDTSGTRPYMAPEQWLGKKQDAATDQYSLAVLAHELLTGEVPFASVFDTGDPEVMMNVVGHEAPELSKDIPVGMRKALTKALAKSPEDRFQSCGDFVAALEGTRHVASASPWVGLGAVALAVALAIGGFAYHSHQVEAERQAEQKAKIAAAEAARIAQEERIAEEKKDQEEQRRAAERAKEESLARAREAEHAAEPVAFELSSKAESDHTLIDAETSDFKSFFAAEIRAFENSRRAGDDAKRSAKYVIATNLLTLALNQATEIKNANDRRNRCGEAIASADRVCASAADVGAVSEAKAAYEEADEQLKAAKDALRGKKFDTALSKANAAERRFGEIRSNVVSGVLALAREHAKAERWEQCLKSAEKVLGWEPANGEAKALRDEANGRLVPSMRLVACIGAREVKGAKVQIGDKTSPTPVEWKELTDMKVVGGYSLEYTEDGRKYVGKAPRWTIDWRGSKTMTVNLTEFKGQSQGDTKTITLPGGAKLELVWCPPGSFIMGSPESEDGRSPDEKQHRVTLTKGFWMGKYEVTQKQWENVMGTNPSYKKGANRPVENVSWDDCQEFCRKAGLGLRLPTEAEWEYACRAGSTTAYSWGNALNGDKANCDGNHPCGTTAKGQYKGETCNVGTYEPNAWGLYDMHGNVREWCLDGYGLFGGDAMDPAGPASGSIRVYRGGGWISNARYCRSARRNWNEPGDCYDSLGFRVACSAGSYE